MELMLYIDPGTGSMLFTVIIGMVGAVVYLFRVGLMKIKMILARDKDAKINSNKLPIVIFSDHRRYWNVFGPICDELEKRGQTAFYYTMSEDDPGLSKEYKNIQCEYIGSGNEGFSKMNLLNAYIVLSTTPNLDVYQWRKSKLVDYYVHIPHAAGSLTLYRMFALNFYDGIMYSGEFQKKNLQKLFEGKRFAPKDYIKVGIPYMDDMLKRVKNAESKPAGEKKTVLLAPSWGPSSILSVYGEKIIDALLKTDYNIVIRPHPQSFTAEKEMMDRFITKYPDSERLSWNRDNDNFDVLNKSDILISDFSSVVYDFALVFNKPIIYATSEFDVSVYDHYFLEEEPWEFQVLPRLGPSLDEKQFDDLSNIIDDCINGTFYKESRETVIKEVWANIGSSSEKVADFLIKKLQKLSGK